MEKTEQFIKELGEFIKKSDSIIDPIYPRFEKLIEILDKEQPQKGKNKEVVNLSIFDPLAKFYDIDEAKDEVFEAFCIFLFEFLDNTNNENIKIKRTIEITIFFFMRLKRNKIFQPNYSKNIVKIKVKISQEKTCISKQNFI